MESDEQPVKRDFADQIPAETRNRWDMIKRQNPRTTRQIHIIAFTGLCKPVIVRAMTDNMATENTLAKINEFFNQFIHQKKHAK